MTAAALFAYLMGALLLTEIYVPFVPGDLRYTHCDCAEPAPCSHVPLAVWAFRRLAPDHSAGILATSANSPPAPLALLDDPEAAPLALTEYGVSGTPRTWADRLARLENACR